MSSAALESVHRRSPANVSRVLARTFGRTLEVSGAFMTGLYGLGFASELVAALFLVGPGGAILATLALATVVGLTLYFAGTSLVVATGAKPRLHP